MVDRVSTHDGAFRRLLHIVIKAEVGQVHVIAHGFMRVVDAFAQFIGAGADGFQSGKQLGVFGELWHVDEGGDEIGVQTHFIIEGFDQAAALGADVRHACFFLRGEVDEKGQLGLDGGKGCHDVRHVLLRE